MPEWKVYIIRFRNFAETEQTYTKRKDPRTSASTRRRTNIISVNNSQFLPRITYAIVDICGGIEGLAP